MRGTVVAAVLAALAAVTAVLSAAPASADGSVASGRWWSFTFPPGWTESTAAHGAEVEQMRHAMGAESVRSFVAYASPDGAFEIVVTDIRMPGARGRVRKALAAYEQGARDSIIKDMAEVRYAQREDGNTVAADHVIRRPDGVLLVMRRVHGIDPSGGFVTVSAMCSGDEPTCSAAMLGLHTDASTLQPFDAALGGREHGNTAYDAGYQVGRVLGSVIMVGIVLWWAVRRKRKRAASGASVDR